MTTTTTRMMRSAFLAAAAAGALWSVPAAAQPAQATLGAAIAELSDELAAFFSRRRDELRASGAPVTFDAVRDSQVRVACQPLSRGLRRELVSTLGREMVYLGLQVDPDALQSMADGAVFIALGYQKRGDDIQLNATVYQSSGDRPRELGTFSRFAAIDSLDADSRACLDIDEQFGFVSCTSTRPLPMRDTPGSIGDLLQTIQPGTEFQVLASFNDGAALLVEIGAQGVQGAESRGFLPVRLATLRRDAAYSCLGLDDAPRRVELRPGVAFRDCDRCPEMIPLPFGLAQVGSALDEAGREADEAVLGAAPLQRQIALGVGEVTHGDWAACVEAGACAPRPGGEAGPQTPVAVSHDDASAYLGWLSTVAGATYRLPTEAEWEYAARAGAATRFAWGDVVRPGHAVCRSCGGIGGAAASFERPQPRGARPANLFGLHDMHGNLWEWVSDCAPEAHGGCGRRILKGGAYDGDAILMRAGNRHYGAPEAAAANTGFRAARDID
ncbi:MAG: formylglycine-generating enzyme family protein [Rubrimonas sp.]|uniref:formylglycine-generating enzyme family protein n=1 Tax=Rubrimonas sp. TaxID=2036015 RepID=UPI002FDDF330